MSKTMTGSASTAARERHEREKLRRDADADVEELHSIGHRCGKLIGLGPSAAEHGDLLYDERGLPK